MLTPYIVKRSEDLDKLRMTLVKLNELEKQFVKKIVNKKLEKKEHKEHKNENAVDIFKGY